MTMLSSLATIFGTAMALANSVQAYKIFKRKSAKDISVIAYTILAIGAIIWVLYGIEITNLPLIISNSIGTAGVLLVILGYFLYGSKN
jgi:MtN3 and saliva related transmembrane protein